MKKKATTPAATESSRTVTSHDDSRRAAKAADNTRALAFLAGVLVGLGPVVALLSGWSDISTPTFVGLAMSVFGGVLGAIFVPRRMMLRIHDEVDRALSRRVHVPKPEIRRVTKTKKR